MVLLLVPGALTRELRASVMARSAAGYVEAEWLSIVPANATIIAPIRSRALMPRPFLVADPIEAEPVADTDRVRRMSAALRQAGVAAVVLPVNRAVWHAGYAELLDSVCARPLGDSRAFQRAARNPFNRVSVERLQIHLAAGCEGS